MTTVTEGMSLIVGTESSGPSLPWIRLVSGAREITHIQQKITN